MLEYKLMIIHNAGHNKCNSGKGANRQQSGDPSKLANAVIGIAGLPEPPVRFVAAADAVAGAGHAASLLQQQAVAFRALSS